MASTINALTTGVGGIQTTGDTSGNISLQSNGSTVLAMTSSGVTVTGTLSNGSNNFIAVAPGTNGNVLTSNGSAWTSAAAPSPSGGATITSSAVDITLTSSSNRVQNVAMTASGKSVILPDATTLSAGGPTFIITNNGTYSFLVKNASGAGLLLITPGQTLILGLASIATSDGKWVMTSVNASSLNISASGEAQIGQFDTVTTVSSNAMTTSTGFVMPEAWFASSGGSMNYASPTQLITLSSTSALFVYTRNSNNNVYAVVITLSGTTLSVGTETLVYTTTTASPAMVYSIGLSSTAAFVNVVRTSSTILTYPLVIAGSTITVGTASTAWGLNTQGDILAGVAMDSTTALISNYGNAALTNYYVRTLIHNGTSAPTIGTPTILTSIAGNMTYGGMCKLTSTTAFYYYSEASVARVVTISGSSAPTLGTSITIPASFNAPPYRYTIWPVAHSSTEVVLQNYYSTTYVALTISGTTVTVLSGPAGMPVGSVGCLFYYDSSTILALGYGSSLQRLKYSGAGTSSASLSTVAQTAPLNYYYYGNVVYGDGVCGCVLDGTYAIRGMYNSSLYPQVYLIKLL